MNLYVEYRVCAIFRRGKIEELLNIRHTDHMIRIGGGRVKGSPQKQMRMMTDLKILRK